MSCGQHGVSSTSDAALHRELNQVEEQQTRLQERRLIVLMTKGKGQVDGTLAFVKLDTATPHCGLCRYWSNKP